MNENMFRIEKDALGNVSVPQDAYYGAGTQRALENFTISGMSFPLEFIHAIALIKKYAAHVNHKLGFFDKPIADAIWQAATEVMDGKFNTQFRVDVFQTGSGTSTNMNVNEVISSRANEILSGERVTKGRVHPNDHVNLGQSSNDVIPSALHIAAALSIKDRFIPALQALKGALQEKAAEFSGVQKIGRTHLQDAVPMTLGQEFSGYARQAALGIDRINSTCSRLKELALGGTAVGNGVNTHETFAHSVIALISKYTGHEFVEAANHFEAQGGQDAAVEVSGALKTIAVSLSKIANDIRWLGSGPRCGLGELILPSLAPGSSIMPGKVNPVIPEAVIQAAAQVIGNDTTITLGGQGGYFELNVMLPVITHNLLQSISLLTAVSHAFADKCIKGLTADEKKCGENIAKSLAMATYLVPFIGYDKAAVIARKAYETGKTVKEIAAGDDTIPGEALAKIS